MDHRNKIQSLVLPTYMALETPRTALLNMAPSCEYGHICHKSAKVLNLGVSPQTHAAITVPGATKTVK